MATPDLSDAERRALALVDADALVDDLVDLISVPSISGSDAECEVQHHLAERMRGLTPTSTSGSSTSRR